MFLTPNNKIKWRRLAGATAATLAICGAGVLFFDRWLYLKMRLMDNWVFQKMGDIFQAKAWLIVTAVLVVMFYIKKTIKSETKFVENIKHLNIRQIFTDFLEKTKNSYAFFMFCSILSACVVTGVLKIIFGRARPIFYEALDIVGFFPMATEWAFHSMPSGHATASFASLVMMGLLAPKMRPVTWTLATVVGISRVCVGAHWPTDVILGAFIGMVAADFVKAGLFRRLMR